MGSSPRLSLCIPTAAGRTPFLKMALTSAIQEALAHPAGVVEVLVSDNGCPEPTKAMLREFQVRYPWLRCTGFPADQGFDPNYLNCFQQATGDFVWVMGDDDMFMPGCVAKVLEAVNAGADAILVAAYECDAQMQPLRPRGWFKEPIPSKVWQLNERQDLIEYFHSLQYEAGAFGFISAAIIRRERFLENLTEIRRGISLGWIHVFGMMIFLSSPASLHWISQPLFLNRLDNDSFAVRDPYGRMLHDLNGWIWIANACFPKRDELRDAFMGVLRRNHQDALIRNLRVASGTDSDRWIDASSRLLEVGFDPVLVNAVNLCYEIIMFNVPPPSHLHPDGLCLADLPMVARGARRTVVLAETGLDDFLAATALLARLRLGSREAAIRVVCTQDQAPLLTGFELTILDWDAFRRDVAYREAELDRIRKFAPDLLVNLDRQRRVAGDILAAAAGAAGALGFDHGTKKNGGDVPPHQQDIPYRKLMPKDAPYQRLGEALGLPPADESLWPDPASQAQARAVLGRALKPGRTLAVLGDAPAALAGAGALALDHALRDGWTAIGLGGPGTQAVLGQALAPFGAKAVNQGGSLPLAAMAAVLQSCGAFLGGSPTFQALARAAGCQPFDSGPSQPCGEMP